MTDLPVRVVLDANILFSRVLHERMGRAGSAGLFNVAWSDELLQETRRALIKRRGLDPDVAERWVDHVRQNFPDGKRDISNVDQGINLARYTPDADDQHVCALAIVAHADVLVSSDRGFRSDLLASDHGITARTPDDHLVALFDDGSDEALLELLERWAEPRVDTPVDLLLEKIENAGCGRFAGRVRAALTGS